MEGAATKPLLRFERCVLWLAFVLVTPIVGGIVEYRSALLSRRMGDLGVFLRAAWAVRADADPYAVTCDNDWHYSYPPLLAILMTPLADPPRGADATGYVPYAWSVAIFFLLNVVCLYAGVHALASALEERSGDLAVRLQPTYCRRWWHLRYWPVLVCFLPIVHTMVRGQANILVLATLCFALAGWLRGHNFRAGLWLALAICIKVIPVYLLVYPVWKRDGRGLAGAGAGLVAGLIVIPVLVFGPAKTVTHYETYARVFFGPFFKFNEDHSRKDELLGINATDSVGVNNALFNWTHPNPATRPADLPAGLKLVYLVLGVAMTLLTLWPGTGRGNETSGHPFTGLIVLMTIFSPICHSHYLLFCLPLVMSLLAAKWQFQETLRVPWVLAISFAAFAITIGIAYLPGMEILKDRCAALFATLPLWAIAVLQTWRPRTAVVVSPTCDNQMAA